MKAGGSTCQLYQHAASSQAGGAQTARNLEISSSSRWVMGMGESSRMRVREAKSGPGAAGSWPCHYKGNQLSRSW